MIENRFKNLTVEDIRRRVANCEKFGTIEPVTSGDLDTDQYYIAKTLLAEIDRLIRHANEWADDTEENEQ